MVKFPALSHAFLSNGRFRTLKPAFSQAFVSSTEDRFKDSFNGESCKQLVSHRTVSETHSTENRLKGSFNIKQFHGLV